MGSDSLLPMIQLAITPVILIAGVGSLLLSMTNRLGRIVDRTRILAGEARVASSTDRDHLEAQLRMMYRRAKIVRFSVTTAAMSMFGSGLLVVLIFLSVLLEVEQRAFILVVFSVSIVCLLISLAAFIREVFLSLNALGLEVERGLQSRSPSNR
jgi:hypothetical protein